MLLVEGDTGEEADLAVAPGSQIAEPVFELARQLAHELSGAEHADRYERLAEAAGGMAAERDVDGALGHDAGSDQPPPEQLVAIGRGDEDRIALVEEDALAPPAVDGD